MAEKSTKQEFVEKSLKVHGTLFDYTQCVYVNAKTKMTIVCKEGHSFEQTPNAHLSGNGCGVCSKSLVGKWNQKTIKDFLEKALKIHGDKFDYSEVVYEKENLKVIIKCKNGHVFEQTPNGHLSGKGCKLCSMSEILDKDSFTILANSIHKSFYNYDSVVYVCRSTPIIIKCKEGHYFKQSPRTHLKGHGCAKCAGVGSISRAEFVSKAKSKHSNKYCYDSSVFTKVTDKIDIHCNTCKSTFKQLPSSHLQGVGCPNCARSGYKATIQGFLYCLEYDGIVKVGITNRKVLKRVSEINIDSGKKFEVVFSHKLCGKFAREIETYLKVYLKNKYLPVNEKFDGHTECFIGVDIEALADTIKNIIEENPPDDYRPNNQSRETETQGFRLARHSISSRFSLPASTL